MSGFKNKHMRKNCYQSKKDNPNWGEKINLEDTIVDLINITECFIGNGPKVMMFIDKQMLGSSGILSYSCEGLIK